MRMFLSICPLGLVRKDLLPRYAGMHTPATWLCASFDDVGDRKLATLACIALAMLF
jgi:hypothetical protein